jgi:hypothetical protein
MGFFFPKQPSWKSFIGGTANHEVNYLSYHGASSHNTTCENKGLLTYNSRRGITSMKKHIDNEHKAIVAKYVLHL